MKNNKVLGVGEVLLRLTPPSNNLINQCKSFDAYYGGGEFNVLASLANFGIKTSMLSKLPKNEIGNAAIRNIQSYGIDTKNVLMDDKRIGIYFSETGFSQRSSKVVYDRKNSSFWNININDFDYEIIFKDVTWLHISGITPALNDNTYLFTENIINEAKKRSIKISFDINWRSSLWENREASSKFSKLVNGIDLCIGTFPLDINYELIKSRYNSSSNINDYYYDICSEISSKYNIKNIAFTNRVSTKMNENTVSCFYYDGNSKKLYSSDKPINVQIIDRIGTGDAYTAGILYGLIENMMPNDILNFAEACFVLKHTINGDCNMLGVDDIKEYIKNKNKQIKIIR